ncbi:MAG: glycosyltransferase family 4 protein [Sutterella sp.]|nr:glycosyltransferase family 4 protein [Sutterella sp.]
MSACTVGIACHSFRIDGGMGRYVYGLAEGLLELGITPTVFTKKIDRSLPIASKINFVHINCRFLPSKLRDYYFNRRLAAERRKHPVDVMISCNRNTHSDIGICGGTHIGYCKAVNRPLSFFDKLMISMEKAYYANCRLIIAHSDKMRAELIEYYGIDPARCPTVYPPVSPETFAAADFKPIDFGAGDRYTFLIPSAGNHQVKGLDLLAGYFERSALPITLLIAGRPFKPESPNVRYIGFRKDMPDVYRSVDFTILGSRYEAFGLVGIESVASGTPVVLSRNVGSSEVISPEVCSTFDPYSFESFEEAVSKSISRWPKKKITDPWQYLSVSTSNSEHVRTLLDLYSAVSPRK